MTRPRILILGGSGEGFALAELLCARGDLDVISSLAGRTPAPKVPVGGVRRGGFGGVLGLETYLRDEQVAAVIDATHPFADQISRNAAEACVRAQLPCVHVCRAPWEQGPGDDWREVENVGAAADAIPQGAENVFLTTGKTELAGFAHRDDVSFIARIVAPLSEAEEALARPSRLTFIYDRGPFALAAEKELIKAHNISMIVTKNSGGEAASAKLEAARALGLAVIMVKRPAPPPGDLVYGVDAAAAWLDRVLGTRADQFRDETVS